MKFTSIQFGTLIVLFSFLISGCVSTTTGGGEAVVDKNKALETRIQLTLGYISQSNRDSARINLNKARDIDSDDPRVNNAAALLYQLEGEPEQAEIQFKLALKKSPQLSFIRNNYGVFLSSHGRNDEALEQFQLSANDLEYNRRDVALANLGQASLKLGLLEKAKSSFEHASRLNPRSGIALVELAELEFMDRNYSPAKKYLDRLSQITKQGPRSLWLGIRLERIFGNKDKEASLALALKNLYPYSAEYLEYKRLIDE